MTESQEARLKYLVAQWEAAADTYAYWQVTDPAEATDVLWGDVTRTAGAVRDFYQQL